MATVPSLSESSEKAQKERALKRLSLWGYSLIIGMGMAFSITMHSWQALWAAAAFVAIVEVSASSLHRLLTPGDRPLTFPSIRGLDQVICMTAAAALLLLFAGAVERYLWFNMSTTPGALVQLDYRGVNMTEDQYRQFAWDCETQFGKRPMEIHSNGQNSFIRCGGVWPGVRTLAAQAGQLEASTVAFWRDPHPPHSAK